MSSYKDIDINVTLRGRQTRLYRDAFKLLKILHMAATGEELSKDMFNELIVMAGSVVVAGAIESIPLTDRDMEDLKKRYEEKMGGGTATKIPDNIKEMLKEVTENIRRREQDGK